MTLPSKLCLLITLTCPAALQAVDLATAGPLNSDRPDMTEGLK